jgi:diguanylate cyclase (GGDEF)-like protein/PAS domain S-box-containing protein
MARWSLPAALLLAGLAFAAATGLALNSMHQSVWREAESRGREVALALANGVARDLARVDVTLRATAFGLGRADPLTDIMEVQRRVRQHAAPTSADALVPVVVVLDAAGNTLASTGLVAPELLDGLLQDAAFRTEAAGAMQTAAISRPLRAGPQAPWHVAVGRGFGPPEGLQGGVVAALVPLESIALPLRRIDLGPEGLAALLRRDGMVLVREPEGRTPVGQPLAPQATLRQAMAQPGVPLVAAARVDKQVRLYSTQEVPGLDLVVALMHPARHITARWQHDALLLVGADACLLATLGAAGLLLGRERRRRAASAAALAAVVQDFTLLAEHASDMIVRVGLDGVRIYVSPGARRLLGRSPEDMVGQSVFAEARDGADHKLRAATERLLAVTSELEIVLHTMRHAYGHDVPVETALRLMRDAAGRPVGWVAVNRDNSARLAAEAALRQAASHDTLTGLANRRGFEDALAKAWARCAAASLPLSVLLLDLDGFKALNDAHGHPAGDAALRGVATRLRTALRRSDEVAGRLGGDEMALLLPGANAEDAHAVAERLRAMIEVAARSGQLAPRAERLSASIGVASAWPTATAGGAGASALLAAADAALYRAKREGRNCVRLAA